MHLFAFHSLTGMNFKRKSPALCPIFSLHSPSFWKWNGPTMFEGSRQRDEYLPKVISEEL
ncbi:hypothetical protein RC74_09190 [Falsihalocynthiibacter arcticus]|uniref:Uncharacterized protein n=1 Tax=Falsihalocynthiibacter arcticus TaxID=1579316 RepID=A0A126V0D1_9RHOB|nr:hypothetical protein RC74_09190 [Falsihalocynthiibacter arcticus]